MTFALPTRQTINQFAVVALLTCGNIATIYGAWQLREAFGNLFGHPLANALLPFVLLCLPLVAVCGHFEFRGFKVSRLVGLPVKPGESPWVSAVAFGVLGVGWVFLKGGLADREMAKAEATLAKPANAADSHHKPSPGREAVETVVFVVVLVLMLKLFVVEAFVIPTGSMAETLYGYKKIVTCAECGFEFPVNASREAEPPGGSPPQETTGYCCPNCRYENATALKGKKDWSSGDRVLVGKFLGVNDRGHVVVFKFPDEPQTKQVAQNYIKRLVGLPGETVAIFNGDLYVTRDLKYADRPMPENPNDTWRAPFEDQYRRQRWPGPDYRYTNAPEATKLFADSQAKGFALGDKGFEIVRKPDELVLSMRRIVYDNDHQSQHMAQAGAPPRWQPMSDGGVGWSPDSTTVPKVFTHTGSEFGWVRYQNLVPKAGRWGWTNPASPTDISPQPITNFMGYNAGFEDDAHRGLGLHNLDNSNRWVGDLMLECEAKLTEGGTVVLELSKGDHRYRAEFDQGQVRLKMFPDLDTNIPEKVGDDGVKRKGGVRTVPVGDDSFTLATRPSGLKMGATHRLRFANVDCRLRVWVDDTPIDFGGKADYAPPGATLGNPEDGKTTADIDRPACVGASGPVTVSRLKVWRDSYYVNNTSAPVDTYFVQPGHYLCMGDNSSQSSDGRMWGLVPERLMLGRAVFIFYPVNRIGFIR